MTLGQHHGSVEAAPLGIIQDFGWFGVALFFLISGFIISDRAAAESTRTFVISTLCLGALTRRNTVSSLLGIASRLINRDPGNPPKA